MDTRVALIISEHKHLGYIPDLVGIDIWMYTMTFKQNIFFHTFFHTCYTNYFGNIF